MEAPKPTLATTARIEERYQTDDEEERKRKSIAAIDPIAAKHRSEGFRRDAVIVLWALDKGMGVKRQ